jgi:hypothetical protein
MTRLHFVLARNEAINQWLNEHPAVLGGIFVALGLLLAGYGVYEIRTGITRDKYGNQVTGSWGRMLTNIRITGGIAALGFGLYKLILG